MEKFVFEYEKCHCSKIAKEVTITSMVIEESDAAAAPCGDNKQALDCNKKEYCGVLALSGKEMIIDWFECTHPKFLAGSRSVN